MNRRTIEDQVNELSTVEDVLNRFSAAMVFAARKAGLSEHDTEDFVQDCRTRIVAGEFDEKVKSLTPQGFVGKIVGMARNYRTQYLRRAARTDLNYELVSGCADHRPNGFGAIENKDLLEAAIQKLLPRYQRAIRLWSESVSYRKIAADLELSLGAAKVLVSRARSALAKAYFDEVSE